MVEKELLSSNDLLRFGYGKTPSEVVVGAWFRGPMLLEFSCPRTHRIEVSMHRVPHAFVRFHHVSPCPMFGQPTGYGQMAPQALETSL